MLYNAPEETIQRIPFSKSYRLNEAYEMGDNMMDKREYGDAPGILRFGKRFEGDLYSTYKSEMIPAVLRFGKREFDKKNVPGVLRFGKRDGDIPGVLRFGKRNEEIPGVLRFGKRNYIPDVLDFGKRTGPGILRFGRR